MNTEMKEATPLRPILRNGNPLLKAWKCLYGKRIFQRPTPRHLWSIDRPRMCYLTCQQLPWCPAHGHTSNLASTTKKPIVVVAVDVKKIQTTKKTRSSDMVAKGMMKVHAAHRASTPVMKTSKALE